MHDVTHHAVGQNRNLLKEPPPRADAQCKHRAAAKGVAPTTVVVDKRCCLSQFVVDDGYDGAVVCSTL